jgi:hypothetical protein
MIRSTVTVTGAVAVAPPAVFTVAVPVKVSAKTSAAAIVMMHATPARTTPHFVRRPFMVRPFFAFRDALLWLHRLCRIQGLPSERKE